MLSSAQPGAPRHTAIPTVLLGFKQLRRKETAPNLWQGRLGEFLQSEPGKYFQGLKNNSN